jgi:lipopolysaccharide transport system ATP-binding protein
MSEIAISIANLSKSFRRFNHPGWRALGALGVPVPASRYDMFSVLTDINLEIKRGEKVALIGRNGVGKSTLLRLVSGQMRPDAGGVLVKGKVQALMEMGTGFHPDFTGIENIRSALAFQGLSPAKVADCIADIADFTELDDFLLRPVKEYSTGMYARLAFAVATSITPEILLIDEVLGAGDAYFLGKSIQRMKALTGRGATILFVSHDMGSVQLLCDRGIWLDQGSVREDGPLLPVSKAYLASIRDEEEWRVKARSMSLTKKQAGQLLDPARATSLLRLIGEDGGAPKAPTAVAAIRYGDVNGLLGELRPGIFAGDGSGPIVDTERMNWQADKKLADKPCWLFADHGGRYRHAPIQIVWPHGRHTEPWIEIDYRNTGEKAIRLDQFDPETQTYQACASMAPARADGWQTLSVRLCAGSKEQDPVATLLTDLPELASVDRYGTGEVRLTGFSFFDGKGAQRHTLLTGEPAFAVLSYQAAGAVHGAVPVIAVYRPDGICAMQLIASLSGQTFAELKDKGGIRVDVDPLLLGPGDYLVSVALFKEMNLGSSIEPDAYDLHDRCYALKVLPPIGVQVEIGTVNQPAVWKMLR